jgi:hypothetical protein
MIAPVAGFSLGMVESGSMARFAWVWACAGCGFLAAARADKEFAYKFVPGEEYRAVNKFERTTKRTIREKRVPSVQSAAVHTIAEVSAVDPKGVATVNLHIAKVEFAVSSVPVRKYISDDPKHQDKADGWELYKDARLTATVDGKGKVLSVKPDADTAAYWAQQPRELSEMTNAENLARLLPFAIPLPEKAVTTNVGWREPRTFDDGRPLGKREMFFLYAYAGNRRAGAALLDEIAVRGEVKPPEATAKYDLLESSVSGRAEFDSAYGKLKSLNVLEDYLYNPRDAKLPKNIELTGGAKGGGPTDDEGGMMGEGGSKPPADDAGMAKKKGAKKKGEPKPKSSKKGKAGGVGMAMGMPGGAADDDKMEDEDKSIELQILRSMTLTYFGKPLKDIE